MAWLLEQALGGKPDRNYWWVAPVFNQAEIMFRRMCARLPQGLYRKNQSKLTIALKNGTTLWFKSAERPDDLYGEDVYAVVMDEACFAAGSLVDTPDGPVAIEDLRAGDEVLTAAGTQELVAVRQTSRGALAVVTVAGRSLVCSVDHPFFTARGWVAAAELVEGDQIASRDQAVRILRDRIHCGEACQPTSDTQVLLTCMSLCGNGSEAGDEALPLVPKRVHLRPGETADPAFLHALLCCEMETSTTRLQGEGLHAGTGREDLEQSEALVGDAWSHSESATQTNLRTQADARSGQQSKALRDAQTTGSQAAATRRQRARYDRRAVAPFGRPGIRVEIGVGGWNGNQGRRRTDALDDRHCPPDPHDCGGSGWQHPSEHEGQGAGCSERQIPGFSRVESVAVHKSGSAEFARHSGGADRITLFDLEVAGHPAFSVNGLLVHNSRMREEAWHAIRSTLTYTQGPVRIIGNVKGRKNWFYRLARAAENGADGMAYHRITAWDAVEAGVLSREEIEASLRDFKRLGREGAWRQLYMAEAASDEDNPFGLQAIEACVCELSLERPRVAGVDLAGRGAQNLNQVAADEARDRDYTAIVLLDRDGVATHVSRLRKPHTETAAEIARVVGRTPALIDSTGAGDQQVEGLQRRGDMRVEGFVFNERSRQDLLEGLALKIGEGAVGFPDGWLRDELDSFEFRYSSRGVRYAVPDGMHDDGAMALALAVKKLPWRRRFASAPVGVAKPGGSTWSDAPAGAPVAPHLSPDSEGRELALPVLVRGPGAGRWTGPS